MLKLLKVSPWVPASFLLQKNSTELPIRLTQVIFAVIAGCFAFVALLLLFGGKAQSVQAAPLIRPLAEIITDPIKITHTPATTHQMTVFADGRITDQFLNDNGEDQIGNITGTTIAVMFEQHSGSVDIGMQGEFIPTTPITLNTSSNIPGYSEDSHVVYASQVLSYQIAQRTLATTTNNCVIMELVISNTGSTTLNDGKLLYMVDINAGTLPEEDEGHYDSNRRLVYLTDHRPIESRAYAMGISLLEGDWRGYGIISDDDPNYPDPSDETKIRNELITPTNAIITGTNAVAWIVADIPDLGLDQAATLAFGLCARTAEGEGEETQDDAADNMFDSFDQQANLSVAKMATPLVGSPVIVGEPITYSIAISSTGYRYVDNIVLTDTVPASTDLITYSVSQGSIMASDRLITATIGRLYPASDTVTVTLAVRPSLSSTNGTIISNQAFIKGAPIITATNVVTHRIINEPVLTVTKYATPEPTVAAGERLTYTIIISNGGPGYAIGVVVSDTLPDNTEFVSNSITLEPPSAGITGTLPPILASDMTIKPGDRVTVTYAVTVKAPLADDTIITNTVSVTILQVPMAVTGVVTTTIRNPVLTLTKRVTDPAPWWNPAWSQRGKLTFDNTDQSEDLVNFPVLVVLDSNRIDYSQTQNSGQDIRFIDADNLAVLAHEIEKWDESGTSYVWVKVPQVDGSSNIDHIWLYYGNAAAPDGQNAPNVWDANYQAVWHLHDNFLDSTSNDNDGTNNDSTDAVGKIADGQEFDGADDSITVTNSASLNPTDAIAINAWIYPDSWDNNNRILQKDDGNNQYRLSAQTGNLEFQLAGISGVSNGELAASLPPTNTWHHVAGVYDSATGRMQILVDGSIVASSNSASGEIATASGSFKIGTRNPTSPPVPGQFFDGRIDEVRISDIARSADWIAAQYKSMLDEFITFGNVVVGTPLTYTITVTNSSPLADATNVIVTDTLPVGANYVTGGSFIASSNTVSWTIPTIPAGGSEQVTFVITTCQTVITNTAYRVVTSTQGVDSLFGPAATARLSLPALSAKFDYNPPEIIPGGTVYFTSTSTTNGRPIVSWAWDFGDNSTGSGPTTSHLYPDPGTYIVTLTVTDACGYTDTATNTVLVHAPVLTVTKSAKPEPVEAGQVLTYSIVISNGGQADATGVVVSDPQPANTEFIIDSVIITPSSAGGIPGTPPIIASDITVTAGSLVTVTYAVTVTSPLPAGVDTITNTVSVTGTQAPAPATDTVTTTVIAAPDLTITKDDGVASVESGDTITYTLTIENNSNQGATGVVITETVPDNTSFVGPPTWQLVSGNTYTYNAGSLAAGNTDIITFVVQLDDPLPAGVETITNTAEIGDDGANGTDQNPLDNSDTVTTTIEFASVLTITKDGPTTANVGDSVIFTFTVRHAEDSDGLPVSNITVSDDYAGTATRIAGDDGDNLLAANEVWTYTASYTIQPTDPNPLENTGTVSGEDQGSKVISATATHSTSLAGFDPRLVIDKDGPATARIGDTVVFTFTVINFADIETLAMLDIDIISMAEPPEPGDGSPISSITVTDNIAGEVDYVGGDSNGNDKLDAGEFWTYTASYIVQVIDLDSNFDLINQATATGKDRENHDVASTDTHRTDIRYTPVISVVNTGPLTATVGEMVAFTFTVTNDDVSGDGTPIRIDSVTDSIAGPATRVSVLNDDGDDWLENGEIWIYTVDHMIKLAPNPLINVGTAEGKDQDNNTIVSYSNPHSTMIDHEGGIFLPIILKN